MRWGAAAAATVMGASCRSCRWTARRADDTERRRGGGPARTGLSQLAQRFAHSLTHRRHAPAHGMALERDAERDRPELAGGDVGSMMRAPPVTRHLAAIGARGLDMQPFDGA